MKFNFKTLVMVLCLGAIFPLHANSGPILITHDNQPQMAKWLELVMTGPNINAPEQIIEVIETKDPCLPRTDRLMHLCIDGEISYRIVSIRNRQVKEAFSHLVSKEQKEDEAANKQWLEMIDSSVVGEL